MALPKQILPTYSTELPSTGKVIKFKPFQVREEKALLLAQQSDDKGIMADTLKDVVKHCVVDDIDVESLAMFDLEYLLLQIRAKSIGEIVALIFSCDTCVDPKAKVKINFDLTQLKVKKDPNHTNTIKLFDTTGVVLKYPDVSAISQFDRLDDDDISGIFDLIISSIDYIYSDEEFFYAKDQTKQELHEFINNLTQVQFKELVNFFETMPKLRQDVKYTCPVCGKEHNKYIEGIDSFF